ncbi:hypothetical protein GQ53DRAFT_727173 [Thozetella sp. PMI_491]|nr:hypothetical protein GQ53DRAFT_727173 [Thozetella sp. PMI_491]
MMLLTSSQVSIAVSSGVVVFFTSALFFSGYAIQQRTLREIRASINAPKIRPEQLIFLPDRFKKMTTELKDGTTVAVEIDDDFPQRQRQRQKTVIEIKPTPPDSEVQSEEPAMEAKEENKPDETTLTDPGEEDQQRPISAAERRQRIKDEIQRLAQGTERGYWQPRLW